MLYMFLTPYACPPQHVARHGGHAIVCPSPERPCNPVLMLYNRLPLAHIRLRHQNIKAVGHGTQHTHSHMTEEDAVREDASCKSQTPPQPTATHNATGRLSPTTDQA